MAGVSTAIKSFQLGKRGIPSYVELTSPIGGNFGFLPPNSDRSLGSTEQLRDASIGVSTQQGDLCACPADDKRGNAEFLAT